MLWCCFRAITTIGYRDITVTSAVGRAIVVATACGDSVRGGAHDGGGRFCNELMLARQRAALCLDKLEHWTN